MNDKEVKLEQYKVFVDSAEKNSEKRINQNNIYLAINLAFISYIISQDIEVRYKIIFCILGCILSMIWYLTIQNYEKRNKVKYAIINEMEMSEFNSLFNEEWKRIEILPKLTTYEKSISIIFLIIYVLIIFINLF